MGRSFMFHATAPAGRIFDDERIPALEAEGWVDTPAKLRTEAPAAAAPVAPESGDERASLLLAAVATLDPDNAEHFTKGGLPRVEALEAAASIAEVTREERDDAWAAFRASHA